MDSYSEEMEEMGGGSGNGGEVQYDEVDSSKTVKEAIQDVMGSSSAACLTNILDEDESGGEGGGAGINLDAYVSGHFTKKGTLSRLMD